MFFKHFRPFAGRYFRILVTACGHVPAELYDERQLIQMYFAHQIYALERLIKRQGQEAALFREKENSFHEPDGVEKICRLQGLFHESNGYLGQTIAEAGKVYTAKQPMFLIRYTDIVHKQDILELDGQRFRVVGLNDLGNLRLILDISMEVLENV